MLQIQHNFLLPTREKYHFEAKLPYIFISIFSKKKVIWRGGENVKRRVDYFEFTKKNLIPAHLSKPLVQLVEETVANVALRILVIPAHKHQLNCAFFSGMRCPQSSDPHCSLIVKNKKNK